MGLLPKRSWLGVFIALYMHLWRSHRKLVNAPQDLSYEDLTQPLLDGQQHRLEFERHGEARQINAHSTPPGWSGKTVVLIHDVKMRLQTWSPVWDLLREDGHRIIAVDLPGHGESNLTAGSLVLPSLTRDIQHIMDHFEVSQGVLVGHGVGGFLALQYFAEYRKRAAERLPFGFVCVACTAGNLKQTIGKERLRQMATAFAAVRLPELLAYFEFSGEASVSRRLGSNASYPVVRVILEAKRQAQSDWALRNLSDMCRSSMYEIVLLLVPHTLSCSLIILMTRHESRHEGCRTACHERLWTLDLHPAISNLALPSGLLLSDADDRVPQPFALKMAFASTGKLHYFKMLEEDGYSLPLTHAKEVAAVVTSALKL